MAEVSKIGNMAFWGEKGDLLCFSHSFLGPFQPCQRDVERRVPGILRQDCQRGFQERYHQELPLQVTQRNAKPSLHIYDQRAGRPLPNT